MKMVPVLCIKKEYLSGAQGRNSMLLRTAIGRRGSLPISVIWTVCELTLLVGLWHQEAVALLDCHLSVRGKVMHVFPVYPRDHFKINIIIFIIRIREIHA